MTSRLLTAAELCHITGDEQPLTDADVVTVVRRLYGPDRAAPVLSGKGWRPTCAGHGSAELSCSTDRAGIYTRFTGPPPRAGLVPWATAEQVITDRATPETARALIAAVDAYAAHCRKFWPAKPGQTGPARTDADHDEGHRLIVAMREAWRAVMAGGPVQLGLFAEVPNGDR